MMAITIWLAPYTGGICTTPNEMPRSALRRISDNRVITTVPMIEPLTEPMPPIASMLMTLNVRAK